MKHIIQKSLRLENLVIVLGCFLVLANFFFTLVYCRNKWNYSLPFYHEPGYQFFKFKEKLGSQPQIGYLTNKDLSQGKNDGIYLQAQYFFAPTLVKLNDSDNPINILDYSSQIFVFYMVKTLNAEVLADNPYGQVLIRKKP